jgi:signal transduction histidine kinase
MIFLKCGGVNSCKNILLLSLTKTAFSIRRTYSSFIALTLLRSRIRDIVANETHGIRHQAQAEKEKNMRTMFESWQQRRLAKFTPDQREEIAQLIASLNANAWRACAAFVFFWIAGVAMMRYLNGEARWAMAILLPLIVVAAVAFGLLSAWLQPTGLWRKSNSWLKLALIATACSTIGAIFGGLIAKLVKDGAQGLAQSELLRMAAPVLIGGLVAGVIYAVLTVAVLQMRRNLLAKRNEQLRKLAADERIARQLTDAKLRLMQAQVEPHFLFNTLASVQHLAEANSPDAAKLTAQLINFLRGGLSGLREEMTTLEREFAMAASYLEIMRTRMGQRLSFAIELPPELANQNVPPAMLISLVENAIKHGLEPAADGGHIDLIARKSTHELIIEVKDTGQGSGDSALNSGVGLSNIRERLKAIYGEQASLKLSANVPTGFIATLSFPATNKEA